MLSQPLVRAIEHAIGRRAGVLLFLNRKGYAGALVCRDCGQVPRCPACRVALMYSRQADRLLCSYCGDITPIPETCASCSGPRMQLIGEGTERVEEDAKRLFPHAAVIRLDGDTMHRPAQAEALWRRVERRGVGYPRRDTTAAAARASPDDGPRWDCAGGRRTQRAGFPIRRTYAIIRSLMRSVSPIRQPAGGRVIVQTYLSSHHAIQAVAQNDESIFLSEELSHRTALGYPPAVYLIALLVSGTNEKMVHDAATGWAARLTACSSPAVTGQTARQGLRRLNRLIGLTVSLF